MPLVLFGIFLINVVKYGACSFANKINESCYSFYIHMQSGDIIEIEGKNMEIIDN